MHFYKKGETGGLIFLQRINPGSAEQGSKHVDRMLKKKRHIETVFQVGYLQYAFGEKNDKKGILNTHS